MTRRTNLVALTALGGLLLTGIITAQNTVRPTIAPEATLFPEFVPPEATVAPEATLEPEATPEFDMSNAKTVRGGGISFQLPATVAVDVIVQPVEAMTLDLNIPPGGQNPANTLFSFDLYLPSLDAESSALILGQPELRVFKTADFAAYDLGGGDGLPAEYASVQRILAQRPELYAEAALPLVPLSPSIQTFHAREQYIDFDGGSGILYLAHYGFGVDPILEGSIVAIFQGISDDGETFISATFPVITNYLARERGSFDDSAFEAYIQSIRAGLNDWAAVQFTPNLNALVAMFASIKIGE